MKMMMRLIKISALVVLLVAWMPAAHGQISSYLENHKFLASILSEYYGIPTPVILAVAAVESAGGDAPVAKVLNNHFGIVGKNTIVNKKGHKSRYKQYNNVFESYIDFCNVISQKSFYNRLKDKQDLKAWVLALSHAGYSEEPEQWEKKIFGVLSSKKK